MTASYKMINKIVETKAHFPRVGAKVRRNIDEFSARKPAGYPDHPHRGFETVTYMLEGIFQHEDFKGHKGMIGPGDVQWMTAGRGIVHAEMPFSDTFATGLQVWLNLPAKDKMMEPKYQDVLAKDVPLAASENGEVVVKVIAGDCMGVKAKVHTNSPIYYLDVKMEANNSFEQVIPANWTAFVYTLSGTGYFGKDGQKCTAHATVLFEREGATLKVQTKDTAARFVLLAGEPINEPIVQHGPFVMNTGQEINEAMYDYQMQQNGFEGAHAFVSKISQQRR